MRDTFGWSTGALYVTGDQGKPSAVMEVCLEFWLFGKDENYLAVPGFVYVLRNKYHSEGLYKVGRTDRHPILRAQELSRETSSPGTFEVVEFRPTDDSRIAEWLLFQRLLQYRITVHKEFVECAEWLLLETMHRCSRETCYRGSVNARINELLSLGEIQEEIIIRSMDEKEYREERAAESFGWE